MSRPRRSVFQVEGATGAKLYKELYRLEGTSKRPVGPGYSEVRSESGQGSDPTEPCQPS